VVSEEPTRKIVKELREAGFTRIRRRGSHSRWEHKCGIAVSVPDGHRTISPKVVREARQAIQKARSEWTPTEQKLREKDAPTEQKLREKDAGG
jgi:predicted RNA binding protein YcfA (HicA-like mRNA interferase family)